MKKMVLHKLFESLEGPSFAVRYWDGDNVTYGYGTPSVRIVFHRSLPLGQAGKEPVRVLGEAYMDDILDFEGSMDELMRLASANRELLNGQTGESELYSGSSKENIAHHYDIGNDFYRLWLDETMSYSCAYFLSPGDSLACAQKEKISHSLRKLHLRPGQTLLDIGSGWGHLIVEAAREYGVRAVGITLSEEQVEASRSRIAREGLEERVEVRLQDYRELTGGQEQFDRVVSIGMFEHVGRDHLDDYMTKVEELLRPGGLSLLHSIMSQEERPVNPWVSTWIFPGGYIPSLRETVALLPDHDFHLMHAESLRLHYARTLDHWAENFAACREHVEATRGRRFARMWDLYLRSCAANFRTTGLNIYQLLFSKGLNNESIQTCEFTHQESGDRNERDHGEQTIHTDISEETVE